MKWLATSDLHLTDNSRDSYRFGLFKWLAKQQEEQKVGATFILGDLTDKKDKHASILVNRIIDELLLLKPPIYCLRGNHDGLNPENPFFRFVNNIDGVHFIVDPKEIIPGVFMIPHQRTQEQFNKAFSGVKRNSTIMVHQTFNGAIAESNSRLSGLSTSPIESVQPWAVWAGDVHKPQQCGPVTYVGAPYHVRFGDHYTPRVLLIDTDSPVPKNLYFECPRKFSLTVKDSDDIIRNKQLKKKDQIKLTIRLTREEVTEWKAYRQRCLNVCKEMELEVFGIDLDIISTNTPKRANVVKAVSPQDVLSTFCKAENLGAEIKAAGEELL